MRSTPGGRGRPNSSEKILAAPSLHAISLVASPGIACVALALRRATTPAARSAGAIRWALHAPCSAPAAPAQHASTWLVCITQQPWHTEGARLVTIARSIAMAAKRRMPSFYWQLQPRVRHGSWFRPATRYEKLEK
jgi:hypothetical protein